MKLVDSHCHLDDHQFDQDREPTIERARTAGIETLMAIGTGGGPPDLEAATRLAERYPFIYATVGVHPHDAAKATGESFHRLRELARHPKVLAIGEIGLDNHYDFSPRPQQRDVFERQLNLAAEAGKPDSTWPSAASSPFPRPRRCGRPRASLRPIAFWSRPILPISHPSRCAENATSRRFWWRLSGAWQRSEARLPG